MHQRQESLKQQDVREMLSMQRLDAVHDQMIRIAEASQRPELTFGTIAAWQWPALHMTQTSSSDI